MPWKEIEDKIFTTLNLLVIFRARYNMKIKQKTKPNKR